jgi:hypothetical protein
MSKRNYFQYWDEVVVGACVILLCTLIAAIFVLR